MNLLFVYGTLRAGGGKEWMLTGSRRLRAATIQGALYDLGAFPALVIAPASTEPDPTTRSTRSRSGDASDETRDQVRGYGHGYVHGEIWECPDETLRRLDAYEGVEDGLFLRISVRIGEDDCWTYVAGPHLRTRLARARPIRSGVWRPPPA
jgi:gamma-glutamylcyclotransferase (GGCT)/AIG2-like uncharacterized protein YtfP